MNPRDEAVRSLTARFRQASSEKWDADRCAVEAASFIAILAAHGLTLDPNADWRTAPRAELDPQRAHRHAAEARAVVRQAVAAARHTQTADDPERP